MRSSAGSVISASKVRNNSHMFTSKPYSNLSPVNQSLFRSAGCVTDHHQAERGSIRTLGTSPCQSGRVLMIHTDAAGKGLVHKANSSLRVLRFSLTGTLATAFLKCRFRLPEHHWLRIFQYTFLDQFAVYQ